MLGSCHASIVNYTRIKGAIFSPNYIRPMWLTPSHALHHKNPMKFFSYILCKYSWAGKKNLMNCGYCFLYIRCVRRVTLTDSNNFVQLDVQLLELTLCRALKHTLLPANLKYQKYYKLFMLTC